MFYLGDLRSYIKVLLTIELLSIDSLLYSIFIEDELINALIEFGYSSNLFISLSIKKLVRKTQVIN